MPVMRGAGRLIATALAVLAWAGGGSDAVGAAEPFILDADLSYDLGSPPADPDANRLDVYTPRALLGAPAPVVVYVHGGSWRTGDKGNRIADKARLFSSSGMLFVSVNYRLSPNPPQSSKPGRIRFPAHPNDLGEAIGWLERNIGRYGGDPRRLILVGHSAGAQLVSLIGTDPRFVRAHGVRPLAIRGVVALDTAAFDLVERADPQSSPLGAAGLEGLWNAFATGAENAADGTWQAASPLHHADRRDAPHLLVTQARSPGRIAVNAEMATALGHSPASAVVAVDADHAGINAALGDPADASGETTAVLAFVREALAVDAAPRTRLTRRPKKRAGANRDRRRATVRFGFSATDERARFECRIDRRSWRRCVTPRRYRLAAGLHRFRVRAKTRDGKGPIRSYRFRVARR
jgi:arylformamidase